MGKSLSLGKVSVTTCDGLCSAILKLLLFPPKILSGFHLQRACTEARSFHMSPYWQHERNNSMHRKECDENCLVATPCLHNWTGSHCRCVDLHAHLSWGYVVSPVGIRNGICLLHLIQTPWPKKFIPPLKHLNCFRLSTLNGGDWEIQKNLHWFNPDPWVELRFAYD